MTDPDDGLSSDLLKLLEERGHPTSAAEVIEGALTQTIPPLTPNPAVLSGLMERVRTTDRIARFAPSLCGLFDLTPQQAQALLADIRDPSRWSEGPGPGVKLLPVEVGPGAGNGLAAVVRIEPGAEFPDHPHLGREQVLVLEGAYADSGGAEYWRGELHESAPGTSHSFRAMGPGPCLCASLTLIPAEES